MFIKQGMKPSFIPSRQFIYYNERVMNGTVNEDSGAQLADGAAVLANIGAPPETIWPYTAANFKKRPTAAVYSTATDYRLSQELNLVQDINHFKSCLAEGYPFVGGFSVFEAFESEAVARTGIVPTPGPNDQEVGGHAIMIVGYDDSTGYLKVRNSWGASWGDKGYFYVKYEYFTNPKLASDFWMAKVVSM